MGIIDAVEPWQDEPGEEQDQQTFQIFAQVYLAPSGNEDADQSDQTDVLFIDSYRRIFWPRSIDATASLIIIRSDSSVISTPI